MSTARVLEQTEREALQQKHIPRVAKLKPKLTLRRIGLVSCQFNVDLERKFQCLAIVNLIDLLVVLNNTIRFENCVFIE